MIEKFNLQVDRDEYLITSYENPERFMRELCNKIYSHCDERSKIKAILCNVYFLSIYNKYHTAKELFVRSHIYEIIQSFKDHQLKILFNRTLAQLGLSAFRIGEYNDSYTYLNPLCSAGTLKLKEFLSQSYNKENEKSLLFDKEDKKRMIPYIMTINIEEVESTYYIVSMVIDLPNIILSKLGKTHKMFNPLFKKLLDNYTKQVSLSLI
jgi:translation initiation factor 3 subunit C